MIFVGGMDECSYGSWVGNVWAACVILDENDMPQGLADSKKLSAKKRAYLYDIILDKAVSYGIGFATSAEIDEINILKASWLAMRRAYDSMGVQPTEILVDGNKIPHGFSGVKMDCIIKGDSKIPSISAASILAKVSRTKEMEALAQIHPQYGFDKHQGYGTKQHLDAILKFGILPEHRKTFSPMNGLAKPT